MGALLNRRRVGAIGAALLIIAMVLLLVPSIEKAFSNTPSPDPVCATDKSPHFYTNDVPDTNFFGPAVAGDLDPVVGELHVRRCADPALVVAHAYDARLDGFAQLSGDEAFTAKIVELMDNRDLWRQTVAALEEGEEQATAEIVTMSGSYQTLYMADGIVPQIRQAVVDRPTFVVLKFTLPDGSTRVYKLDCGFQPVRQGQFPGVPKLPPPPGCQRDCTPPQVCRYNPALPPDSPYCLPDKDPTRGPNHNPGIDYRGPTPRGGDCQCIPDPGHNNPDPSGQTPGRTDPPVAPPAPPPDPATGGDGGSPSTGQPPLGGDPPPPA